MAAVEPLHKIKHAGRNASRDQSAGRGHRLAPRPDRRGSVSADRSSRAAWRAGISLRRPNRLNHVSDSGTLVRINIKLGMEMAEKLRDLARLYRAKAERALTVNEALSLTAIAASYDSKAQVLEKAERSDPTADPPDSRSS
jgi:hypothetical protein